MKRLGASAVLLFLIIVFGLWGYLRTEHTVDLAIKTLDEAQHAVYEGNGEAAEKLFSELSEQWTDFCRLSVLLTDSEHALEITMSIARLTQARENELISECNVLRRLLEAYLHEQKPTILNIL